MSEFEKEIRKKLRSNLKEESSVSEELYDKITNDVGIEMINTSYSKQFKLAPLLACCLIFMLALLSFPIINGLDKEEVKYNAIVQMDVNPSIQMVIDENNYVLSINGLNDDGKVVIQGEKFIGQKLEDVIHKIVEIELSLGYFDEEGQIVSVSVSTDNQVITGNINEYISSVINKLDVNATLKHLDGYTLEELKKYAKVLDPTLSDEQLESFTYDDYVNVIKAYHLEVAHIGSVKLEQLYLDFKNMQINIVEKEEVVRCVEQLDNSYQDLINNYQLLYQGLNDAYKRFDEEYFKYFLDSTSEYQQAWDELADAEKAYLKQLELVNNLQSSDEVVMFRENIELISLENQYKLKLLALETIEVTKQKLYEEITHLVAYILNQMSELETELPTSIKDITINKIYENDVKMNAFKKHMLASFEEKYRVVINDVITKNKNRKAK